MPRKPKAAPQCGTCRAPLIFARVTRWPIPLNPEPDPAGTIAAYVTGTGGRVGRWLTAGEQPYAHEKRYAQHKCPRPPKTAEPQPDALFTDIYPLTTIT